MDCKENYLQLYELKVPFVIKKNRRAKRITFRYYSSVLHLSVPYFIKPIILEKTINELKDDLYKMIKKSKNKEISFNFFDSIFFFGKEYTIYYDKKERIEGNKIYLKKDDPKKSYLNLAKKYGLIILKERANFYLSKIEPKLELKEIKIRDMVSCYGNCNFTTKVITLNLKLAFFSIEEIDSVIIHELIHLIYPNHSSDFYKKLLEYCPNYYQIKEKMKGVSIR